MSNEPSLGRIYNGLYFDGAMERELVKKNLGPLLHKSGYTTDKLKLMIHDDNVNFKNGSMESFSDTILGDVEAKKYVSGIAYHWYGDSRTGEWPDLMLDNIHKKHPDHFTLMTEACHLEGLGNGRWDFGEHYAHDIIRVFITFCLSIV